MKTRTKTLTPELLHKRDAWWRAANHLSIDQIYLHANPLLKKPLKLAHIKPRRFSHWGTTPGLNFIYVHLMIFPPGGVIPYSRAPTHVVA